MSAHVLSMKIHANGAMTSNLLCDCPFFPRVENQT